MEAVDYKYFTPLGHYIRNPQLKTAVIKCMKDSSVGVWAEFLPLSVSLKRQCDRSNWELMLDIRKRNAAAQFPSCNYTHQLLLPCQGMGPKRLPWRRLTHSLPSTDDVEGFSADGTSSLLYPEQQASSFPCLKQRPIPNFTLHLASSFTQLNAAKNHKWPRSLVAFLPCLIISYLRLISNN